MCKQTSLEEALINNSEPGVPRGPVTELSGDLQQLLCHVLMSPACKLVTTPEDLPVAKAPGLVYYRNTLIFAQDLMEMGARMGKS